MRYRTAKQFRWNRLLWLLLGASVVGLLLPTQLTGRLMNLVQVLVPVQAGAARTADRIADALSDQADPVPPDEYQRVLHQAQVLRRTVAALSARIAGLEEQNRQLTALRDLGLGSKGVLIPARLVAGDLLDWRDSALLDAGLLRGVQPNAAVTTRTPGLDVGTDDGARDGMAVLAGEVLIGWVEHAGTHTARVKLLSDPTCRMPVTIGRFHEGEFTVAEAEFWLVGARGGRLVVIDVDHRYIEADPPQIQVGDLVITPINDPKLPLPLTIGTVSSLEPTPENRLLYTLTVESAVPAILRQAYVLDLEAR